MMWLLRDMVLWYAGYFTAAWLFLFDAWPLP